MSCEFWAICSACRKRTYHIFVITFTAHSLCLECYEKFRVAPATPGQD